jgi:hypothetical protein
MDFILETLLNKLSCKFNFGSYRPVAQKVEIELLTFVSRVILEKTGQKLHAFYETRKFITLSRESTLDTVLSRMNPVRFLKILLIFFSKS